MQYLYYVKKLNLNFENSYVPFEKLLFSWWKKVLFAKWHIFAPTDCTDCCRAI